VSPYASPSPTRSALNFGGSRKAPTADELRERIRVEPAEGEESPAPAPRPYTPLSSATTSSYVVGVTPRSRNPEAERITEGLAASYRSISSPSGVPKLATTVIHSVEGDVASASCSASVEDDAPLPSYDEAKSDLALQAPGATETRV